MTGLLYVDPEATDLHTAMHTCATPLNVLDKSVLCPGSESLAKFNASLR